MVYEHEDLNVEDTEGMFYEEALSLYDKQHHKKKRLTTIGRSRDERRETLKKKSSLKYCVMYFLLAFIYLTLRVALGIGSFASVNQTICEYDDAYLMWPNIPIDVINRTIYKEDVLVVSWSQERGFSEGPSYEGRLMQIEESGIRIIKAKQSDSGTYKLIYNSPATDISEASINLQVIVPPTDYCIPNISREGDTLRAELPEDDCGVPMLKLKWMNGTENSVGNIVVQPGTHTACAVGDALQCFKGNTDTLCANSTLYEPDLKNENGVMLVTTVIVPLLIILILIIVGVILACYFKRKSRRRKSPAGAVSDRLEMTDVACERQALIQDEISANDLADIKLHLIHQYKTLKSPDLSSSGKLNLPDVSQVYFDLEITCVKVENVDDRGNAPAASLQDIFFIGKRRENTAKNVQPIPAVIMGQCGIGKSTWCKNIVNKWCWCNGNMESNVKVGHTSIPEVARFEILLFVPLKNKLEGHSFADCLRHELFCNDAFLFVNTMNYIAKHGESVLIIIDGLDAVTDNLEPIGNLLRSEQTFPCTTILTSRPDGLECLQKKEKRTLRLFKMHGLQVEKTKEYSTKVVGIYCGIHGNELNAEQLWEGIRHHQVQSLFKVPLLCSSLVLSWIHNKAFLDNLTDFLFIVVECYLRRAMTRRWFSDNIDKVLENNHFEIKIKDKTYSGKDGYILKFTSTVAKQILSLQIKNNQSQMAIEIGNLTRDIGEDCVQLCVETGILVKTFVRSKTRTVTHISFSHVLLFDFFAALSLAMGKRDSSSKSVKIEKVAMNIANIKDMLQEFDPEYWTRNIQKRPFWQ